MSTGSGSTLLCWEVASGCSREGRRRPRSNSSKPRRPAPVSLSTSTSLQVNRHVVRTPEARIDLRDLGARVVAGIAWKRFVLLGVARAVPWPGTRHRDRTDGPGLKESIVAAATSKEVVMPIIVVTRLRLRDPALLDEFFTAAVAALEQAKSSDGNLGADVLADANNAWWTLTAWQERGSTQAFVGTKPHLSTMTRLD